MALSGMFILAKIFSCDQAALSMVHSVRLSVCLSHLFTPQPSGLEGYCRHGPGGRAGGRAGGWLPDLRNPYLCNRLMDFLWSSMELSRPVVVHCHGHCPFAPYGLAHGPKTCQICHQLGQDFADRISLKLLDGFTPFEVSWTCLDL